VVIDHTLADAAEARIRDHPGIPTQLTSARLRYAAAAISSA
jgi:hypothetical protein